MTALAGSTVPIVRRGTSESLPEPLLMRPILAGFLLHEPASAGFEGTEEHHLLQVNNAGQPQKVG